MTQMSIADILGLKGLTKEEREETLEAIAGLIFEAVLVRAIPLMPEEKLGEFESILTKGNDDAVYSFLEHEIPSFVSIVEDEVRQFHAMSKRMMPV